MSFPVHPFQTLHAKMRVYLSCGKARMPQHLLYRPQVRTAIEEMRCEGMTEHMRGDALLQTGMFGVKFNPAPSALS